MLTMPVPLVSIFEVADYGQQIDHAARLLKGGGVVVLPTETVYGAAAVLGDDKGMVRLKAIRGSDNKPFTIHLARREQATRYIGEISEVGQRLMKKLWPGPVSLVFDVPASRRAEVARSLGVNEAEIYHDGTITLRCPDHVVASDLLGMIDKPIVLTAARGGQGSASAIAAELNGKADLILDAGPTRFSKPSTMLRVKGNGYEIVREGVYDQRIIERLMKTTVLFICSGNTCRSPMAEALGRVALAKMMNVSPDDLEKRGVTVISAGAFAMPGARATPQAVEAVKELGADLTKHRSRPLTVELIHQADVIFTMGKGHAAAVLALVPSAADKTMTLDPEGDIDDPIGGDLELYQNLAGVMQRLIEKRLQEKVLANDKGSG